MSDYPVTKLEACRYKDISSNTKVFNLQSLDSIIWVHLPEDVSIYCELYQIDIIGDTNKEVPISRYIHRECNRPWIKINKEALDTSIGQHIYKLSFIDTSTEIIYSLFFSYIIQDDNPDRPYIYMNRDNC